MITEQQLAFRIAERENKKPRSNRDFTKVDIEEVSQLPKKIWDELNAEFPGADRAIEKNFRHALLMFLEV